MASQDPGDGERHHMRTRGKQQICEKLAAAMEFFDRNYDTTCKYQHRVRIGTNEVDVFAVLNPIALRSQMFDTVSASGEKHTWNEITVAHELRALGKHKYQVVPALLAWFDARDIEICAVESVPPLIAAAQGATVGRYRCDFESLQRGFLADSNTQSSDAAKVDSDNTTKPGSGTENHQSIFTQDVYKNKSFEQLRVEDYLQGRRFGNDGGKSKGKSAPNAGLPTTDEPTSHTHSSAAFANTTTANNNNNNPEGRLFGTKHSPFAPSLFSNTFANGSLLAKSSSASCFGNAEASSNRIEDPFLVTNQHSMGNPLVKPSSMSLFGNATNPNSNPGGPLFGMKQPSTASSNSSDGRLFGLGNNTMSTRSVANELFSAKRMSIIDLTGDGPTQLSDNTAMSGDDAGLVLSHENRSPPVDVLGGRALSAGMSSTKGTAGGTIFASVPRNIVASNTVPFYGNPGQPLSFVGSNGPTHFAGQQQQQQPFGGFPHSPHFANQQQQPYSVCWQPVFQVTAPFVNQLQQQLFQGLQAPADFSHLHYQQQQYAGWHPGMYLANQQQLQQQPFNGPIYFTHQSQQQQLFGGFQPVAHLDGQHQNQQQTSDDANKQPVATKASQSTQRRLG